MSLSDAVPSITSGRAAISVRARAGSTTCTAISRRGDAADRGLAARVGRADRKRRLSTISSRT